MDLLRAAVSSSPDLAASLAKILLACTQGYTPTWFGRARITVVARTKPDGSIKRRAISVGEVIPRLFERVLLRETNSAVNGALRHDLSRAPDGALRMGVLNAAMARSGRVVAALDVRKAYDAVSHEAVISRLAAAGVPQGTIHFYAAMLRSRCGAFQGEVLYPPSGRGMAQGSVLAPAAFALVAETAANAAASAGNVTVFAYLDNLVIAGTDNAVVSTAATAAVMQWRSDGMAMGDNFALNGDVQAMEHQLTRLSLNDPAARVMGVAAEGPATDRIAAACRLVRTARSLPAQSCFSIVKHVALASATYDCRVGADDDTLQSLQNEVNDVLVDVCDLPRDTATDIASMPPTMGGLGMPLLTTMRDAQVLQAGISMLCERGAHYDMAWESLDGDSDFFVALRALAQRAGYTFDRTNRAVSHQNPVPSASGAESSSSTSASPSPRRVVTCAPRRLCQEVQLQQAAARLTNTELPQLRDPDAVALGSDVKRGCIKRLLLAAGPKPQLSDGEFQCAVALHCAQSERDLVTGRPCPACGMTMRTGHHRVCKALAMEQSLQHDGVRDTLCAWLNSTCGVRAVREKYLDSANSCRADIVASNVGNIELKTLDMRAERNAKIGFARSAERTSSEVQRHYRGHQVRSLIIGHNGCLDRDGATLIAELQLERDVMGCDDAADIRLDSMLGAACARSEWRSRRAWHDVLHCMQVGAAITRNTVSSEQSCQTALRQNSDTGCFAAAVVAWDGRDRDVRR